MNVEPRSAPVIGTAYDPGPRGYHRATPATGRNRLSTSRRLPLGLCAALVASAALLAMPAAGSGTPAAALVSAVTAWPQAQRGSVQPKLADGTEYRPGIFLDA